MSDVEEDYNEDDYIIPDDPDDGKNDNDVNFEDLLIGAKNTKEIEKFAELIELERSMSNTYQYSFQSYQYMCIIYIEQKKLTKFAESFKNMVNLYDKVEYNYKMDTMREINFALTYVNDLNFLSEICRIIIDDLKDKMYENKSIARELLNTGILFCKNLITLNKVEKLGELLEEMFEIMATLDVDTDDSLRNSKLEFLVIKIQYCNSIKMTNEAKNLYFEADKLNKDKVIMDNSLSSIINEQGGRLYMMQKNYEKALEKFKMAFYNYQDCGNHEKAKIMMKYSILNSIIARNNISVVSNEEAKFYLNDPQLNSLLDLKKAYESANINLINEIWNEKIKKTETDEFIINQLNEILHEIRFNYIKMKLSAYRICRFDTIRKELGVDNEYLVSILLEISSNDSNTIKLDFTNNTVHVFDPAVDKDTIYPNINKWINKINNQ